ncbi:Facilitated trehalose transporter Tret1 [Dufourea novaeangliae]|uniref:Facilitated trehalose transporter Tret1 n=2 Tax=Dufourea novaeangliae TaxID=178035 RepID=A0A154PMH2_DUFNO|nr:Facilitated trehalose transporter Tret1 [Dufourea novaeangliae]
MGGFSLGCAIGWSAPCVELLKSDHSYEPSETSLIASALPLGAAMGMIVVPFLIDRIGRKWTMMSLAPVFVTGWIVIVAAIHVLALVIIGRLITGACGGMFCVAAPIYSAEISEKEIRGTLGVFFQLLLVIGVMYGFCCGFSGNVITISVLCGVGPIIFLVMMFFMPESPLFYLAKEKEESAMKSMRFFRGPNVDIGPEIEAFKEQVRESKRQQVTITTFLEKPVLKTLGVAIGLMFAQQFSGINAIIFFGETIFKQTGVDMDTTLQMVIFAVVQVIACLASAVLIDQLGRKFLMIMSSGAMCLCLISLGIFFILKTSDPETADSIQWLPLTSTCLYILAFCLGAGPVPWAYMGEIFPTRLKGVASSIAAFVNWTLAFIVTESFSSLVDTLGTAAIFFIFAVFCFLSVIFVIVFMIETKGKTLAQIQTEFGTIEQ